MGTSPQSDFLRALYQSWSDRMAANPAMTIADLRSLYDEWHQPTLEPEDVTYKSEVLAGVEAIWALPQGADAKKVILYTHGGGFAVGSAASHRKLAGHLAKHLGVTAVVIDYRRAPSIRTRPRLKTRRLSIKNCWRAASRRQTSSPAATRLAATWPSPPC